MMASAKMQSYKRQSADACTAPACQFAPMSACAYILDAAALAVSFLFRSVVEVIVLGVRIMLPCPANP